jgi:hypothetical protein
MESRMKIFKALILVVLLSGMGAQSFASDSSETIKEDSGWIFDDVIINRPPPADDGPGSGGR